MRHIFGARFALSLLLALFVTQSTPGASLAMAAVDDPIPGVEPAPADARRPEAAFPPVGAADPVVAWMVGQVSRTTVEQYDGDLSGEHPVVVRGSPYTIKTRNTNSGTPIQQATYYVGDHLRALGLTVEEHRWGPSTAPSIIGQDTGKTAPGEIYLVGAHLDDMPTGATAPGADDNASGSTAVLIAADILSQFDWNCTLRFALWTGEEQGLLGSDKYADRAKTNGETIRGVLNLDMIGWNTAGSLPEMDLHAKASMPGTVDLANQAASVIGAYGIDLLPEVRADGTGSSDHASFWKFGYDAILGIEDYYPNDHDFDPYYHSASDKLATLDVGYFTEFVKVAVAETAHMAGCLVTGTAQGRVTAAHDGSGVAAASITLTDAAGRAYQLGADPNGGYSQRVPPQTYGGDATAYGYGHASSAGLLVAANTTTSANFVLSALSPVAPAAGIALDGGEVRLTWAHVDPDTGYTVRRSENPYFAAADGAIVATVEAAHPPTPGETASWRDPDSGAGQPGVDRFYLVMGQNAAGAALASNRVGEIDFTLVKP